MITLPGYTVHSPLYLGPDSNLYRGHSNNEKQPVIIQAPGKSPLSARDIAKIKREYEILSGLYIDGVVRVYELIPFQDAYCMVFEDFEAMVLSDLIKEQGIDLLQGLIIGIEIAKALGETHQKNIIHKDIKPDNFLVNLKTGQVKIFGFQFATLIAGEKHEMAGEEPLEGSLEYMAPESTGRMNCGIDHRADLYSLGVVLYEMFAKTLPFQSTDPLELIYAHIAKKPFPLREKNQGIPRSISDIVMKLLAKDVQERYQSGFGLGYDLEKCFNSFNEQSIIPLFSLGRWDFPTFLHISQQLYGRKNDVDDLLAAYERVRSGKAEMLLVKGSPGIGKTVLIRELQIEVASRPGFFISGKFDQFKHDRPYSCLSHAFDELVRQILTQSPQCLDDWRERIMTALGPNGQVVTDTIPALELIIGKQPKVEPLPPIENQNRFNGVFFRFFKVFAINEQPLILFLDDLQWADPATLKLLKMLMLDHGNRYFLIVGAYRDTEVHDNRSLTLALEEISGSGAIVNYKSLELLTVDRVTELVCDTFRVDTPTAEKLAKLIHAKTLGNPFFVKQFLAMLYQDGLVFFDTKKFCWDWDLETISKIPITTNVVDLMKTRIQALLPATKDVLGIAACIGSVFDLSLLAGVSNKTAAETADNLWAAIQAGLIMPIGESYKYLESSDDQSKNKITYCFAHDQIRQAAYSLIPENKIPSLHYRIGMVLKKSVTSVEMEEKVFDIARNLNKAGDLVVKPEEQYNLARLNLTAGRRAKSSAAYQAALKYINAGIKLLAKDSWQSQYELTRDFLLERAECEYMTGNFTTADECLGEVLKRVRTGLEKAEAYDMKVVLAAHQSKPIEAVGFGLEGLRALGFKMSEKPGKLTIFIELLKVRWLLRGKKADDLYDLPVMTNPETEFAEKLMTNIGQQTYFVNQALMTLIILKGLYLTLKFGKCKWSSAAISGYGIILAKFFLDYKSAYEFNELAVRICEFFKNTQHIGKIKFYFGIFYSHWRRHKDESVKIMRESLRLTVDSGDLITAGLATYGIITMLQTKGESVDTMLGQTREYLDFVKRTKEKFSIDIQLLLRQYLLNLKGLTRNRFTLSDDEYDEQAAIAEYKNHPNETLIYFNLLLKSQIFLMHGDFSQACKLFAECKRHAYQRVCHTYHSEYIFLYSLALAGSYQAASRSLPLWIRFTLLRHKRKLKNWADNCPENNLHKYLLISAEMARIKGHDNKASHLYDQAIESASVNGFIQNKAIANECAARFYLQRGLVKIAKIYMKEAYYDYSKWGAVVKCDSLKDQYPNLLLQNIQARKVPDELPPVSPDFDWMTTIKVSQKLAGEVALDNLLEKLMEIVLENSGAQRGCLFLYKNGKLVKEAEGRYGATGRATRKSHSEDQTADMAKNVIDYVARTKEIIVLDNAAADKMFFTDDYIRTMGAKSILCIPIIRQGKLTGVLYLENNLIEGAFTVDRVSLLDVLSTQIATSIENAVLYGNLNDAVHNLKEEVVERKLAEKTLRETEQKFLHIFEQNANAVLLIDMDSRKIIDVNQAARLYGYAPGDLRDKPFEILLSEESTTAAINALFEQRRQYISELAITLKAKDGTLKATELNGNAITLKDREVFLCELRDVTEKKVYQQLEQTVRHADRVMFLGSMVSEMAHEVRTPNQLMLLNSQILSQAWDDCKGVLERLDESERAEIWLGGLPYEEAKSRITRMLSDNIQASNRLELLANNLRQYGRKKSAPEYEQVNIGTMINMVLRLMKYPLEQFSGSFQYSNDEDLPPVLGSQSQLEQVLTNLLRNSLESMQERVGNITLTADYNKSDDQVEIRLKDQGSGMSATMLAHATKPFESTKKESCGMGLGLHIANKIVKDHNGVLMIHSEPDIGTEVTIALPVYSSL